MMGLSTGRDEPAGFFRPEVIRVSVWLVLALWLARQLARLLVWIIRTPSAAATITVTTAILLGWHYVHPALPLGVLGGLLAGLVVWRLRWPVTFEAQVRLRVRSWWRAGFVYRRQWATAMDTTGLLVERRRTDYIPPLLGVRSHPDGGPGAGADAARSAGRGLRRRSRTGSRRPSALRTAGSARSGNVGTWSSCGSWSTTPSKPSSEPFDAAQDALDRRYPGRPVRGRDRVPAQAGRLPRALRRRDRGR